MAIKLLSFTLLALLSFFNVVNSEAGNESNKLNHLKIIALGEGLTINYELSTADNDFNQIVDLLKAGKTLRFVHSVALSKVVGVSADVATIDIEKFIKLDAISDNFSYGENLNSLKTTIDKDFIKKYIYSISGAILLEKGKLITGDEYMLDVTFNSKPLTEELFWLKYIPNSWLHDVIEIEELYIAR